MIKNPTKSQRNIPVCPEEQMYKKKSDKKGLARSKHKHLYRTVLLLHDYSMTKPHDPHPWRVHYYSASKVCSICGRVSDIDNNYYSRNVCDHFLLKVILQRMLINLINML